LGFNSDFTALLPDDAPSVIDLDIVTEKAGGVGYLVLALEAQNVESARKFADMLAPELEKLPEITYVDYKIDRPFFDAKTLLYVDTEDLITIRERLAERVVRERKKLNPFYVELMEAEEPYDLTEIREKYTSRQFSDYYITSDNKYLVLLAKPNVDSTDLAFCRKLIASARAVIQKLNPASVDPTLQVHLTGRYLTRVEQTDALIVDLKRASIIAIVGMFLFLILYTKSVRAIPTIFIPLGIGMAWTFGVSYFVLGSLNVITAFLISVLSGLGIDFGIHMFCRYQEERRRGRGLEEALIQVQGGTAKAVVVSAITSAVAFASLVFTDFKGFSHFGFVAGSGICFTLLAGLLLFPALVIVFERIRPMPPIAIQRADVERMKWLKSFPLPRLVLLGWCFFIAFAVWHLKDVRFQYDFRKLQGYESQALEIQEYISRDFEVSLSPTVIYAKPETFAINVKKIADEVREKKIKERGFSTIHKTVSIYTFVPEDQEKKLEVVRDIAILANDKVLNFVAKDERKLVDDLRMWVNATPFTAEDLPQSVLQQYEPADPADTGTFVFIYPGIDLWHGKKIVDYAHEIEEFKRDVTSSNGYEVRISGEASIFSEILELIKKDGIQAMAGTFLVMFLIIFAEFRTIRGTLIIFIPLLSGLLSMCAFMYLFDIELNFLNAVIFPAILGLGEDYSVHLFHRYQEKGGGNIVYAMRHTGSAIILSALTTMLGFGAMIFADHQGLKSIGWLALIGISSCFLSSMTLLPAMVEVLEQRRARKSAPEPTVTRKEKLSVCAILLSLSLLSTAILPAYAEEEAEDLKKVTLEEALKKALKENPTMTEVRHRVEKAEAQLDEANYAVFPKISTQNILTATFEDRGNAISSTDDTSEWGPWIISNITSFVPLYTWGKISSYKEAARHGVSVAEKQREISANDLSFEIKRYFYTIQYAAEMKSKLKLSKDKLTEVIDRVDELLKKESGEVTKQDKYKLNTFLAEVLKYEQFAMTATESARLALTIGMGASTTDQQYDTATHELVRQKATVHPLNGYIELAKKHRPEYALIEDGIAAKDALVRAEKANYYPMFLVGALFDFAYTNVRDDQGSPYAYDIWNRSYGGAGLVAKWDLDFWNTRARVNQLKAEQNEVLAKRTFAANGIPAQIRKIYRELQEADERVKIADTGRENAKKWLLQSAFAFNFGLGDTKEVVDSVVGHAKTQEEYYRAIMDYNMSLAGLTRSVGKEVTDLVY
ncbi:MAG: MMPL family transporter, partial [Deltaproteobacteria bacterium]|nr:MMPL family transporter [Deltaproteobacteria bacterium]